MACLYAATKIETVLAELEVQESEYVHVVGFKVRPDHTIRVFTLGDLFHVHKTGYLRTFGSQGAAGLSRTINSYDLRKARTVLYIDAFLAELLTDKQSRANNYLRTRRLAVVAYQHPQSEGMFYPSAVDHVGMNLALLPHTYANKTNIVCSQIVRIGKIRQYGFCDFEVFLEAINIDDRGEFVMRKPESQSGMVMFGLTKKESEAAGARPLA